MLSLEYQNKTNMKSEYIPKIAKYVKIDINNYIKDIQ